MNQKMQYQMNQMNQTRDISRKPIFGPNLGPIWALMGQQEPQKFRID